MIESPLTRGDGYRHGWVGNTGTGKTWASRVLAGRPGALTFIHDDSKAHPEYPGVKYFPSVAAAMASGEQLTVVGFRGDPYAGTAVEPEEVCELAMRLARARVRMRLVIDELNRAVTDSGQSLTAPSLAAAMMTGRNMGLSVGWNSLHPKRVPDAVWTMSSSVGFFRCEQKVLNYCDRVLCMPDEMLATIEVLPVGDFVLYRPGFEWDRTIYRF